MDFNQYQAAALRTANPAETQLRGLIHAAIGLATETGEFSSEVKRMVFYNKPLLPEIQAHMEEELGDTLWYLALACERLGVSLHQIARQNIAKLAKRFPEKFTAEAAEARVDKGGLGHRES